MIYLWWQVEKSDKKKGAWKSRNLQKKSRDFWTSLVPGLFVPRSLGPVPSRDLPGTSQDETVLLESLVPSPSIALALVKHTVLLPFRGH